MVHGSALNGKKKMSIAIPELFDVKSITKAAIGVMYHIHSDLYHRANKLFGNCTIGEALNHQSGYHAQFDYNEFRNYVDHARGSIDGLPLSMYCKKKMENGKFDSQKQFGYSDYMYQVLASNFKGIAEKFGEWLGLQRGVHWEWEHCGKEALGPHGLQLSHRACEVFATKSHGFLLDEFKKNGTSCDGYEWSKWGHWGSSFDPYLYWNGWWLTKNLIAIAHGYIWQFICVMPNGRVSMQIYKEDWDIDGRWNISGEEADEETKRRINFIREG